MYKNVKELRSLDIFIPTIALVKTISKEFGSLVTENRTYQTEVINLLLGVLLLHHIPG